MLAVRSIASSPPVVVDEGLLVDTVLEANRSIVAAALADPSRTGMGTTVAGVALGVVEGSDSLIAFNVGDSRVYRFTPGSLVQVSADHSVVGELVHSGRLDPAEAKSHPERM